MAWYAFRMTVYFKKHGHDDKFWNVGPVPTETLCSASAILRGTEPISALTRALFILLCSLCFFLLDFVSSDLAERVVNLNTTI